MGEDDDKTIVGKDVSIYTEIKKAMLPLYDSMAFLLPNKTDFGDRFGWLACGD